MSRAHAQGTSADRCTIYVLTQNSSVLVQQYSRFALYPDGSSLAHQYSGPWVRPLYQLSSNDERHMTSRLEDQQTSTLLYYCTSTVVQWSHREVTVLVDQYTAVLRYQYTSKLLYQSSSLRSVCPTSFTSIVVQWVHRSVSRSCASRSTVLLFQVSCPSRLLEPTNRETTQTVVSRSKQTYTTISQLIPS